MSRSYLSTQPKIVQGIRKKVENSQNAARTKRLLGTGKVSDAFSQSVDGVGKFDRHGEAYLRYRSDWTGTVRDTRIVRIRQSDGTTRSISIREKVNTRGQVVSVLAEDGVKARIRNPSEDGLKATDPNRTDKGKGDHAHIWGLEGKRGSAKYRDSLGGLVGMLQDLGEHEFSAGLGNLFTGSTAESGERGVPRDPHSAAT